MRQRLPGWLPARWEPTALAALTAAHRIAQIPAIALCALARSDDAKRTIRRYAGLINSVLVLALLFVATKWLWPIGEFPAGWRLLLPL